MREDLLSQFPILKKHPRLILINANASDLLPQRRWPMTHFKQLLVQLLAHYTDATILLTGSNSERASIATLAQAVANPRCCNFAGGIEFAQLPLLYSIANFMVTNDSGPGHFSAITPLRTYVLFGPETPALYGSLGNSRAFYRGLACSPCVSANNHRKTPCQDNICLQQLLPQQVFDGIVAEIV